MTTALAARVLVLNKHWQAVNIITALSAVCKVYQGKAKIIDENYAIYDFEGWLENWNDAATVALLSAERRVACVNFQLVVPEIIILKDYAGYQHKKVKFSRRNVFERDCYTCQYCDKRFGTKELNIDHVLPISRGGATTWMNVVLSCIPCNHRKRNRTPEEARMKLARQPFEPNWSQFRRPSQSNVPKSWADFLGKMYWNIGLAD
jgi:hypothetical protein